MTSHWWRAYDEAVDDPKLILLSDKQHRWWFNLCCVCSANGGTLPAVHVIAVKLRVTPAKANQIVAELTALNLIDVTDSGVTMHNWSRRQFTSDADVTATDRKRRQRNRDRQRDSHGHVTRDINRDRQRDVTDMSRSPETETETETEKKEREEDAANAATTPVKYVFESGVIRLKEKQFNQWKEAYSNLNLEAELLSLTEWAGSQRDWFFAVSGALTKRDREISIRLRAPPDDRQRVDPRL